MPVVYRFDRSRYTLPDVIDPPTRRCITIEVPDNIYHLAAFYGQILALGYWFSWAEDTAHTALAVAKVWRDVYDKMRLCDVCSAPTGGAEGDDNLIRQNPDNPCLLETSINGTDWCPFADLSLCIPGSAQPGSGSDQPTSGGGQACYHASMEGSNKWLLPTQVNTGDVIDITNVNGAASDGTVSWYCANGASFQFGACLGSGSTSGGDPLNTSPHMMLIAKIGSTYYPMYNTSLTVPSGVTNQAVTFQLNDSALSDNFGNIAFDVCVTNNALGTFSHTFDFLVSNGGFSGVAWNTNDAPTWSAGVGWDSPDETNAAGVARQAVIKRTLPSSRTLTGIQLEYTIAGLSGGSTTEGVALFQDENGAAGVFFQSGTAANGVIHSAVGFSLSATGIAIRAQVDATNGSTVAHAHLVVTKLIVTGLGVDPF